MDREPAFANEAANADTVKESKDAVNVWVVHRIKDEVNGPIFHKFVKITFGTSSEVRMGCSKTLVVSMC
jgi:hypothetical protein